MSTTTQSQKSTVESIPSTTALIGVDGDGDRHYVDNRVTASLTVYVKGDGVDSWNLAETPCARQDDPIEAWIDHVARKRGDWETICYGPREDLEVWEVDA